MDQGEHGMAIGFTLPFIAGAAVMVSEAVIAGAEVIAGPRVGVRDDNLHVIADPGSESGAGPIRNPVSVWHWIPDVETPDLIRGRDDKWRPRLHTAFP